MSGKGRLPGSPRVPGSGRVKGTPNKKTQEFLFLCEQKGFSPGEALIEMALNADDENVRLSAIKEACSYVYPKRKAIEVTGKDGEPLNSGAGFTVEQLKSFIEEVKWKK